MKKFIAALLLTISMFSFFILYSNAKETQIFNMKNAEHHLKNSYQVTIPSKINALPRGQQYEKILNSSTGQESSIYFTRIDQTGKNQKVIKYIFSTNDEYINQFHLIWGKKLDKTLMDTHYFLSTEDTGDENQIGRIASFEGIHMEIHTLQSMLDEGLYLDGPCTVTVPEGKDISFFTDGIKDGIGIKDIDTALSKDVGQIKSNSHFEILILFFILMLLVLYDILKSYKKIGIEKLLGFSTFDIWKKNIIKVMLLQIITMIISMIIMSLVLFRNFNICYLVFFKTLISNYILLIFLTFVTASIPFIYAQNIEISSVIKNKQPIKEIILFNTIIKVCLCIAFIVLINNQVVNYDNIKKVFDGSYKRWEEVSQYRVLRLNKPGGNVQFSNDNIEIYKYFNQRGAIFAGFADYTKTDLELDNDLPDTARYAMVNPNYLKENNAYDINGNKVIISEENSNWILLVPDKYKNQENEIRKLHQFWIDSFEGMINTKIEIIWTKSNQKYFSYNFNVYPDNGYYVTDPILFVGTEKGGFPKWNTQLFNVVGNPFKVKVDPDTTDEDFIKPILNQYGYLSYGLNINYANEQMVSNIKDYKDMFIWSVTGIVCLMLIIAIILTQNIYNFFEQFKVRLAIRQLHGYKKIGKYREYLILLLIAWIIIAIVPLALSLASLNVVLLVSLIGFVIEIITSFILLNYIEKKKIIEFIKGGA